jgi:disulfide bond formation protein DsbB
MTKNINILLFIAWVIATIATLGSLFFSEIMQFIPCTLCWYQRIGMYPLVFILAQGLLTQNILQSAKFALPLAVAGWVVATYHMLLHVGIITEDMVPCSQGVACSTKYIQWFGFVSIPLLSLLAFTLITVLLINILKKGKI